MIRLFIYLFVVSNCFAISADKQAYINLEMANYFFNGKDFDNALKYYSLAECKVKPEELSILICRNTAMIHMIKEAKKKAVDTLERCINEGNSSLMETSQSYRDIIKMYAEIKADEVNPSIQAQKREIFEAQQRAMMQRATAQQNTNTKQVEDKKTNDKVKLGF